MNNGGKKIVISLIIGKYDFIDFNWSFVRPVFQYHLYPEPDDEPGGRPLVMVGKPSIRLYDPYFNGAYFFF